MADITSNLNQTFEYLAYQGSETNTATTTVVGNTIYVDAKIDVEKVEAELKQANSQYEYIVKSFDAWEKIIYATEEKVISNEALIKQIDVELRKQLADSCTELNDKLETVKSELEKGLSGVNARINETNTNLATARRELEDSILFIDTELQVHIKDFKEYVTRIDAELDSIDKRLTSAETTLNTLSINLTKLTTSVADLTARVANNETNITKVNDRLSSQVDRLETKIDSNKKELDENINSLSAATTAKFNEVDTAISDANKRIDATNVTISNVNTNLTAEISSVDSNAKKGLWQLDERVDIVEADLNNKITAVDNKVTSVSEKIDWLNNKIDEVKVEEDNKILANSEEISKLKVAQTDINTRMSTIEQSIVGVKEDLAAHKASITDLYLKIENLGSDLAKLDTEVNQKITDLTAELNFKFNELSITKQDKLGAGDHISIQGSVISATGVPEQYLKNAYVHGTRLTIVDQDGSKVVDYTPSIPTKTSELENDGDGTHPFLTEHQSLDAYRKAAAQDILDAQKQDKLIAGENIALNNNIISAQDTKYTAGENIAIDANNSISAKDTKYSAGYNISIDENNVISTLGKGEPDEYIKSAEVNSNKLTLTKKDDSKVIFEPEGKEYVAGANITINENIISAIDTKYTAGTNITIDSNNVISASQTAIAVFG